MRTQLVALALALHVAGSSVSAQADVRGTVIDSLRSRPLAGALVSVEGTAHRARTDARGRYELRGVPTGVHQVVVRAPFLDSVAIGALRTPVTVAARSVELNVATPSLAQYQRAVCGARLEPEQGVLVGTMTNASGDPAAAQPVAAVWNETVLTTQGTQGLVRGSADTTDERGFFVLCGVPLEASYQVRGGDDSLGTAVLTLSASGDAVRRRDVSTGGAARTVAIRGRLVTAAGAPLEGTVELLADSASLVRTTANGEFELRVAARSEQLWTRVIGYTPRTIDLEPSGSEIDLGDLPHERVPQELAGRIINGRVVTREEFEFEERRKRGFGTFFDSTELSRMPRVSAAALAMKSTAIKVGARGGSRASGEVVVLRGNGMSVLTGCFPRIYVDGVFVGKQGGRSGVDPEYLAELLRQSKRIEVYRSSQTPGEFTDPDGCGSLVLWTR